MRKTRFAPGNYYHIYNRGANKQPIFLEDRDFLRFLFLVLHMQGKEPLTQITRLLKKKKSLDEIELEDGLLDKIVNSKIVELVQFAVMTNHFHLVLYETEENGISRYMQRVSNAYTKYFNTKYDHSGHVFQGPFGAVPVRTDEQILHLSAYVHLNPKAIKKFRNNPESYPWSSYQDFTNENRWEKLLKPQIILDQFKDTEEYSKFVQNSILNYSDDFDSVKHQVFNILDGD